MDLSMWILTVWKNNNEMIKSRSAYNYLRKKNINLWSLIIKKDVSQFNEYVIHDDQRRWFRMSNARQWKRKERLGLNQKDDSSRETTDEYASRVGRGAGDARRSPVH